MKLNKPIQIYSPTRISIIIRLRGKNPNNNIKDINNSNEEKHQYTIFTPNNKTPSDILYISENKFNSETINEILNMKNQNYNLNILNFNKIYPEFISLDIIYQQILKSPINDLFSKKNSCMLFFGPTLAGKSYLLRGSPFKDDNESGLLTRAINDIFHRIEFNNNFSLKISVYQIFLDKIYDLLSNDNNMELHIDTNYSEINNSCNINILGLNNKEIKNSNEYDLTLREAINNRRKLSQILGINEIKQKSHFIISLFLEQKTENNNNIENIPFSQFDFVELVSSNYGLFNDNQNESINNSNIEQNLLKNTKEVFNSLADNIICLSNNSFTNNDTLLTLALKNTMKPGANIIFVNCAIPWEFPLNDSYSSLQFSNMIFNQINKNDSNSLNIHLKNNISNNVTYSLDSSENTNFENNNIIYRNINQNNIINNINNLGYEKMNEYLSSLTIDKLDFLFPEKDFSNQNIKKNYNNEINNEKKLFNKFNNNQISKNNNNKKPYNHLIKKNKNKNGVINKSFNNNKNNINKIATKRKKINNDNSMARRNNISFDNRKMSPKEKRLIKLNEELKELEAKSNELNKTSLEQEYLDSLISYKTIKNDEKISPSINIEYEKIKDYSELKSNNIILREDINRLEQANKNLELSLTEQRNRNIEIINKNEELSYRILKLEELLDEANIRDEKCKINEINIEKLLNEKLFLNSKINEDEKNMKILKEEKEKYEIEYKVLNAKYIELKNNYDIIYNDYNNIKLIHDEKFNKIEDKIDNLLKEIEKLQSENNILRNENEKQRIDLNNISKQRDDYKEKYNEQKNKNDLLCVKINEIENEFNNIKKEKMNDEYNKLKYEENKKNKNENKMKIVNELQKRIQKYREQRLKQEIDD